MDPAALALVDDWPVEHVTVGVITADGTIHTRGEVDRVYRWASVTKLLAANAVLVAVQEEVLSLDDPAGPPGSTVRHLLAHASGLPMLAGTPIAAPGRRRIYSNVGFDVLGDFLGRPVRRRRVRLRARGRARAAGPRRHDADGFDRVLGARAARGSARVRG